MRARQAEKQTQRARSVPVTVIWGVNEVSNVTGVELNMPGRAKAKVNLAELHARYCVHHAEMVRGYNVDRVWREPHKLKPQIAVSELAGIHWR